MSETNPISVEALGHTFNIMPGVGYSLGADDTFAIQWQDKSVYTYRIVNANDDCSYEVTLISEQDCTADLTNFTPFFSGTKDPEDYCDGDYFDEQDFDEDGYFHDDDGMTDAEADADALASCGWGTDEDYGGYAQDYDGGDW